MDPPHHLLSTLFIFVWNSHGPLQSFPVGLEYSPRLLRAESGRGGQGSVGWAGLLRQGGRALGWTQGPHNPLLLLSLPSTGAGAVWTT